jgi:hypothetical protein
VTTRHLLALFDSVYVLTLGAMVGGIVFFTFVVAPIIFRVLGAETGDRFIRALFPRYYLWNAILCSIALPAFVAGPLCFPEYRGLAIGGQSLMLLAIILIMLYAGNSLVPEIIRARDRGPDGQRRLTRLHRRSVLLNVAAMIGGIGLLIAFACRPAPRTQGIVELSQIERARRDMEASRGEPPTSGDDASRGRGGPKD